MLLRFLLDIAVTGRAQLLYFVLQVVRLIIKWLPAFKLLPEIFTASVMKL